jgi:putative selenium metabolism protein SsnA
MPALINCHTHLYSTLARGMGLPGRPPANFPEILKELWWRLDRALTEDDVYYSALIGLMDSAKCGVATVIDHHSSPNACAGSLDQIARAFQKVGLRGATCYETSDRNGRAKADAAIRENIRFLERRRPNSLVQGAFGLHAAFTLSGRTLRSCVEANQSLQSAFHVHVAEDRVDRAAVPRLESAGVLNERTLAAHCVHITAGDRGILARHGVNVIHNPQSNWNNAVGMADVPTLVRRGVSVGLGSDGYTSRLWDEFKAAQHTQKLKQSRDRKGEVGAASPLDLLLTNRDIVQKLWGWKLGRIEPGARADFMLVDYFPPTPVLPENLFGHLFFGIANSPVESLVVNGRYVVQHGSCVTLDERRIAARAAAQAKALWERL